MQAHVAEVNGEDGLERPGLLVLLQACVLLLWQSMASAPDISE